MNVCMYIFFVYVSAKIVLTIYAVVGAAFSSCPASGESLRAGCSQVDSSAAIGAPTGKKYFVENIREVKYYCCGSELR